MSFDLQSRQGVRADLLLSMIGPYPVSQSISVRVLVSCLPFMVVIAPVEGDL